ncbi:hypothetical protein [Flindersiella endophytica]
MTSVPDQPIPDDNEPGPRPDQPEQQPERQPAPERKPLNGAGWIGFGLSGAGFLASLAVGWSGAILVAAIGLAFALTGLIRTNRGRATNGRYAFAGLILAVLTIGLAFFWSSRAQPCRPLLNDEIKFSSCYNDHAGIF